MNKRLAAWVDSQGGAIPLARKLGITPHAIRFWVRGLNHPTVKLAKKIIRLSKNKLSYTDLYGNP
jgi:DNA-binding XRE family transcriptional regulator